MSERFAEVQPGKPGWYWHGDRPVMVLRDGSGGLWTRWEYGDRSPSHELPAGPRCLRPEEVEQLGSDAAQGARAAAASGAWHGEAALARIAAALGDHLPTLMAMTAQIKAQYNHSTAAPIFVVQQRRRVYGFDPNYTDGANVVWLDACNDHAEIGGEEAAALEAAYQETCAVPPEYCRTCYADQWEPVQPFFTQAAAEGYIAANAHRLTDPRVYVDSAYRNREWQAVRALFAVFKAEGLLEETKEAP